jgi:hypothetical protein
MAARLRRVVIFACIHAAVTVGLAIYSLDFSAIDGFEPRQGPRLAGMAAGVLASPGYLLWTSSASRNLPNALEWLLFIANSALWGLLISAVVRRVSARRFEP